MIKITSELLKDLRKAEGIVFRVNADNTIQLELFKNSRVSHGSNWQECEFEVTYIFADLTKKLPKSVFVSGYIDISGWSALIKLIKKDDELYVRIFTNNDFLLAEKGLFNDQLHVTIYRNEKEYLHDILLEYHISRPETRAIKT